MCYESLRMRECGEYGESVEMRRKREYGEEYSKKGYARETRKESDARLERLR